MTQITPALVKELREKTGAGMMDCKKALQETGGNISDAVDWLRKKGIAAAEKKAQRVAAEGLIGLKLDNGKGAIVEVNAETDFVSRNEKFQVFVQQVVEAILASGKDGDEAAKVSLPTGRTIQDEAKEMVGVIGENIQFRRAKYMTVSQGAVAGYIHNQISPGLGRMGALVALESNGPKEKLLELGKKVAMHIVAMAPLSVSRDDISIDAVERERKVLSEQAREAGRPEDIIQKMVEGRLRKFYQENVLLEQAFILDTSMTVGEAIQQEAKAIGADIKLTSFVRYNLGEGIEKEQTNFADEVASQLK